MYIVNIYFPAIVDALKMLQERIQHLELNERTSHQQSVQKKIDKVSTRSLFA